MTTLLRIDASTRSEGSHTRNLGDRFQSRWERTHPGGEVVVRDLAKQEIPHLSQETIEAFLDPEAKRNRALELSDRLVEELRGIDHLLITCPVYNLHVPSNLKAYFDQVVRSGVTFEYGPAGPRGLLSGKRATVLLGRGAPPAAGESREGSTEFLRGILAFLGFEQVEVVELLGTAQGQPACAEAIDRALEEIDRLFELPEPEWVGGFTDTDKAEIGSLRSAQASAILAGNAEDYASLCTESVRVLLPGRPMATGREEFLAGARRLLASTRFTSFRKSPRRVERCGDLALEVGTQRVETASDAHRQGVGALHQKYLHVFRRTASGWKYDLLMSNPDA